MLVKSKKIGRAGSLFSRELWTTVSGTEVPHVLRSTYLVGFIIMTLSQIKMWSSTNSLWNRNFCGVPFSLAHWISLDLTWSATPQKYSSTEYSLSFYAQLTVYLICLWTAVVLWEWANFSRSYIFQGGGPFQYHHRRGSDSVDACRNQWLFCRTFPLIHYAHH